MKEKLETLAALLADYREGDIPPPDAAHVERWISQFEPGERAPVLDELIHLWGSGYLKRSLFEQWIDKLIGDAGAVHVDPRVVWAGVTAMDCQQRGGSQRALRGFLKTRLLASTGVELDTCSGRHYIYLDDILFTGDRIERDLLAWLPTALPGAQVSILVVVAHAYGLHQLTKKLSAISRSRPGAPTFAVYPHWTLENRLWYRNSAEVLWPTGLPAGAEQYLCGATGFVPRTGIGAAGTFASPEGRHVLEQALLKAGIRIIHACREVSPVLRPLGFGPFGVGFGSTLLTWRNCPNNAPLALWWGVNGWYPLVPRKTYGGNGSF